MTIESSQHRYFFLWSCEESIRRRTRMTKNTRVNQGPRWKGRKKKCHKRGQKREGWSEVSKRREGRHRDHREVGKKSHKELGKMSKMSFLLVCLRYWDPFWIIEMFLLRLTRLIRSFDILVWHFSLTFYRLFTAFWKSRQTESR